MKACLDFFEKEKELEEKEELDFDVLEKEVEELIIKKEEESKKKTESYINAEKFLATPMINAEEFVNKLKKYEETEEYKTIEKYTDEVEKAVISDNVEALRKIKELSPVLFDEKNRYFCLNLLKASIEDTKLNSLKFFIEDCRFTISNSFLEDSIVRIRRIQNKNLSPDFSVLYITKPVNITIDETTLKVAQEITKYLIEKIDRVETEFFIDLCKENQLELMKVVIDKWKKEIEEDEKYSGFPSELKNYRFKLDKNVRLMNKIDGLDQTNKNTLMYACMLGNTNIVKYLIEIESNPNQKGEFGFTPLMFASKYGRLEIVNFLTNFSNVCAKNNMGQNYLDLANESIKEALGVKNIKAEKTCLEEEILEVLSPNGFDVNTIVNFDKEVNKWME